MSGLRVTNSQNAWKVSFKGLKLTFFQKLCPLAPHDSLSPKLEISSKLNLFLLDFSSKTTLRYFLKLLLFQFLSFSSRMLKKWGLGSFSMGVGKTYFVQTSFQFCWLGLVPFVFLMMMLALCGIWTCIWGIF